MSQNCEPFAFFSHGQICGSDKWLAYASIYLIWLTHSQENLIRTTPLPSHLTPAALFANSSAEIPTMLKRKHLIIARLGQSHNPPTSFRNHRSVVNVVRRCLVSNSVEPILSVCFRNTPSIRRTLQQARRFSYGKLDFHSPPYYEVGLVSPRLDREMRLPWELIPTISL